VPTHFIRRLNMREQLIREVEIVPLEVVVRMWRRDRCRSGLASRRYPTAALDIEFYYKNDQLNDPWCPRRHHGVRWPRRRNRRHHALAIRVNDFLTGCFSASASGWSTSRWNVAGCLKTK